MSPKCWSFAQGHYGATVRVYERTPGGILYLAVWDPTIVPAGGYRRKSLGHRDKEKGKQEALAAAARVSAGDLPAAPTIGYLVDRYRLEQLPLKKPMSRKWIAQGLKQWEKFLGRTFDATAFTENEWKAWARARRTGAIDGLGNPVEAEKQREVTPGTVNLGLTTLAMLFNWACLQRVEKRPLLLYNPARGLSYLDHPNRKRPVWTHDRFEKVLAAAERLKMQVEWNGKRELVRCSLADVLTISEATGRRIGAVRQLRASNLRLDAKPPTIAWPATTDKGGKAWETPIPVELAKRLRRVVVSNARLGDAPLFPSPRSEAEPIGRETLALYLRRAQVAAGVPRIRGDAFHGLRRKWASERRHLPDVDVAAAGGWRSLGVMKRAYQQADEAGVLEAVLSPRRLREAR